MGTSLRRDRILLEAIVASLVLHLVVALFIPTLAWLRGEGPTIETLAFVRVTHIAVETPMPRTRQVAAVAPHFAPVPHIVHAQPSRPRMHIVKERLLPSRENVLSRAPLIAAEQTQGQATQSTATGAPAAPATPQQEQVASTQTRPEVGGYMPFGAQQPDPVLDPNVVKALSGLNVHVTLTIVVDENGRTKAVQFDPPLDGKVEGQIRSMLADASWDPAVCGGGVACEGRTTIKL